MLSNKTVLMSQKHGHNSSERAKRDEQNSQTIIIKRKIKKHKTHISRQQLSH